MTITKTEQAWRSLDAALGITSKLASGDVVPVSASSVKKITGREPRLMMKFDARSQRPSIINNATIVPISNGEYLIIPGDGYHDLTEVSEPVGWTLPPKARQLQTLPWTGGPASESQLIDMTLASGALHDFLGEEELALTVRGRLRSPSFQFDFNTSKGAVNIDVSGVQVEVDAGLEGAQINLVEAKMGSRTDFHIRQLYYPLRMWQERVPSKRSRAVFMSYSDRIISLRLYEFSPFSSFHGLRMVKSTDIVFDSAHPKPSLSGVLSQTSLRPAPAGVTFPQADDIKKVMDLVDATAAGVTTSNELVDRYQFTHRQAAYYPSAARYLGLLDNSRVNKVLTTHGREFVQASRSERHQIVIKALASLPVFRDALMHTLENSGTLPPIDVIVGWIADETKLNGMPLSEVTMRRRAGTVISWIRWAWRVATP